MVAVVMRKLLLDGVLTLKTCTIPLQIQHQSYNLANVYQLVKICHFIKPLRFLTLLLHAETKNVTKLLVLTTWYLQIVCTFDCSVQFVH